MASTRLDLGRARCARRGLGPRAAVPPPARASRDSGRDPPRGSRSGGSGRQRPCRCRSPRQAHGPAARRLPRQPCHGCRGRRGRRDRVLDVATGTGMVAAALTRRCRCSVVGLDQSPRCSRRRRRGCARTRASPHASSSSEVSRSCIQANGEFDHLTFTYLFATSIGINPARARARRKNRAGASPRLARRTGWPVAFARREQAPERQI